MVVERMRMDQHFVEVEVGVRRGRVYRLGWNTKDLGGKYNV